MKKASKSVTFTCPKCNETFEFDSVGEHEFVPCPLCGIDFTTVRKGQALILKDFHKSQTASEIPCEMAIAVEMER